MGNMSYCQFQNTAPDFEQCLDAIGNCESLEDFSSTERLYAHRMREMAEQYVEWFDQVSDCEEE